MNPGCPWSPPGRVHQGSGVRRLQEASLFTENKGEEFSVLAIATNTCPEHKLTAKAPGSPPSH